MKLRKVGSLIVSLMLFGCGGGGGSDDSVDLGVFFGGVWQGRLNQTIDNCGVAPTTATVEHTVNQLNTDIAVQITGGAHLDGQLIGGDGFGAAAETTSGNCLNEIILFYTNGAGDHADAELTLRSTCGSIQCTIQYTGEMTRVS